MVIKKVCMHVQKSVVMCMHAAFKHMTPVLFEKDDDDNGHIDFITAASVCS